MLVLVIIGGMIGGFIIGNLLFKLIDNEVNDQ